MQRFGVVGSMRRGDDLYAKWRVKSTGRIYEETANLRDKMPEDIEGHEVYFQIKESRLYVYLVSPKRRPQDKAPNGPTKFHYRDVITLHPPSQ